MSDTIWMIDMYSMNIASPPAIVHTVLARRDLSVAQREPRKVNCRQDKLRGLFPSNDLWNRFKMSPIYQDGSWGGRTLSERVTAKRHITFSSILSYCIHHNIKTTTPWVQRIIWSTVGNSTPSIEHICYMEIRDPTWRQLCKKGRLRQEMSRLPTEVGKQA